MLNRKKSFLLFIISIMAFIAMAILLYHTYGTQIFHNTISIQDEPKVSGPVNAMPWENDEKFINAKTDNDTPIMIAAYCTVLPDPLPGEEYNVNIAAEFLAGTVVKSGEVFSQNKTVGPYSISRGFKKGPTYNGLKVISTIGGGVCKVATTLYNVAILCNLQIVERHPHIMPVSYVPYGQDATVSYGYFDFKFKNTTPHQILIWSQSIGNNLYIAFYGKNTPPKIEWHHNILKREKAPTVYKTNPSLPRGVQRCIVQGMDGVTVKSWITIYNPDGTAKIKDLGLSSYKPLSHIIERCN